MPPPPLCGPLPPLTPWRWRVAPSRGGGGSCPHDTPTTVAVLPLPPNPDLSARHARHQQTSAARTTKRSRACHRRNENGSMCRAPLATEEWPPGHPTFRNTGQYSGLGGGGVVRDSGVTGDAPLGLGKGLSPESGRGRRTDGNAREQRRRPQRIGMFTNGQQNETRRNAAGTARTAPLNSAPANPVCAATHSTDSPAVTAAL